MPKGTPNKKGGRKTVAAKPRTAHAAHSLAPAPVMAPQAPQRPVGVGTLGGAPSITRGRASVDREQCTRCNRPELPHKFFVAPGPNGSQQLLCRLCQTVLINLALHDEGRVSA
jgi:hypothetical protein